MTLTFIPLTQVHAPLLDILERDAFGHEAWPKGAFDGLVGRGSFVGFLAQEGDEPVGYVLVQTVLDEAEILSIGIRPDRRGRGYGRTLLAHLLDTLAARHINAVYLEVRRTNDAAIRLYEQAGAEATGVRKRYYDPTPEKPYREDALTYRIALPKRPD